MNLELPVFERSTVKRTFYYFLAFNVIVCAVSILLAAISSDNIPGKRFVTNNTWSIMGALLFLTYAFTSKSKKELIKVLDTSDFKELISRYESYYKKKLIWNGFSIVISALFFVMNNKNLFFYILIIQLLLSMAFFPTKGLVRKELNNNDIIFA
jgi:membrane protease YdiL (CAAX protease family)